MLTHIPFDTLGTASFGWLEAYHHFSFGHYRDPNRMGVGRLRVWNDDTIQAGKGFDPHPHRDMEIITYVRKGAITHQDNQGNQGRTQAGDIQVMSAGSGIVNAEYNREPVETQIFQLWFLPRTRGGQPVWANREFPKAQDNSIKVVASGYRDHVDAGAVAMNSSAALLAGTLQAGEEVTLDLNGAQSGYIVLNRGKASVGGIAVNARDGVMIQDQDLLDLQINEEAEVIIALSDLSIAAN